LCDGKLDSSTLITLRSLIEVSKLGRLPQIGPAADAPLAPQT
jgi:hypothetical protein